jgi:predicted nicotinamide N-methyase
LTVARGITGFKQPIYITDQENMLTLMEQNIEMNSLAQHVKARVYDWGEKPQSDLPPQPDIILAADCVYFEPAFPLLLQTLLDLIGDNSICYFCFKKRRRADLHFIKAIKKSFIVTPVSDDPDHPSYSKENIFL